MNHLALLVRREFWEHRAFLIAPAAVVVIMMIGATVGHIYVHDLPADLFSNPEFRAKGMKGVAVMLIGISIAIAIVMSVVQTLYLLDSLFADRKDRSVLFWKSLPVSDHATVFSKLLTATVALPALTFATILFTNVAVALTVGIRFGGSINGLWGLLWNPTIWWHAHAVVLYAIVVAVLWYLPLFGWLMLVSAWAPRVVILWATLPPILLMVLEWALFGTNYVTGVVADRLNGWLGVAFNTSATSEHAITLDNERIPFSTDLTQLLAPDRFFTSLGFWIGLAVAALFIWGAIVLRQRRGEA